MICAAAVTGREALKTALGRFPGCREGCKVGKRLFNAFAAGFNGLKAKVTGWGEGCILTGG